MKNNDLDQVWDVKLFGFMHACDWRTDRKKKLGYGNVSLHISCSHNRCQFFSINLKNGNFWLEKYPPTLRKKPHKQNSARNRTITSQNNHNDTISGFVACAMLLPTFTLLTTGWFLTRKHMVTMHIGWGRRARREVVKAVKFGKPCVNNSSYIAVITLNDSDRGIWVIQSLCRFADTTNRGHQILISVKMYFQVTTGSRIKREVTESICKCNEAENVKI